MPVDGRIAPPAARGLPGGLPTIRTGHPPASRPDLARHIFTIGLYEGSPLLTSLDRRISPVPITDRARVEVPARRAAPPHPIRGQDRRWWPSLEMRRRGSPIATVTRLQFQPARLVPRKTLSTLRSGRGFWATNWLLLLRVPAFTRDRILTG